MEKIIILLYFFLVLVLASQEKQTEIVETTKKEPFPEIGTKPIPESPKDTVVPKIVTEKSESYSSPNKGKLPNEFIRSMLLSPEHQAAVKKSERLWLNDIFRVGFHMRPRFDYSQNLDFDKRTEDVRSFGTQNSQVWFLVEPTENISVKVTIQDVRVFGGAQSRKDGQLGYLGLSNSAGTELSSPPGPNNTTSVKNNTDLREGFIQLKNLINGFEFYVGRQVLSFGDSRYIGGRNDGQTGNSFDGARSKFTSKYFNSELFSTVLAEETNAGLGNNTSSGQRKGTVNDTYLSGIYNTLKASEFLFDFYLFSLNRKWEQSLTTVPKTTKDRTRQKDDLYTAGFRLTNRTENNILPKNKAWDWTIESMWQFGFNGERVKAGWDTLNQTYTDAEQKIQNRYTEKVQYDARYLILQTGYTFYERFRVGVQFNEGTGDQNRSDSKAATFDASFATRSGGFPYFDSGNGLANATFWSNSKSKSIHLMWNTEKAGRWIFVAWDVQKSNPNDAWYTSGGSPNSGLSSENFSGSRFGSKLGEKIGKRVFYEYDIVWQYYWKDYVSFWAGASVLVAGDSVKNARVNPVASDIYQFS